MGACVWVCVGACVGVCWVGVFGWCRMVLGQWGREGIAHSALLSGYLGKSGHLPSYMISSLLAYIKVR